MKQISLLSSIEKEYQRYKTVQEIINIDRSPKYYEAVAKVIYGMAYSKDEKKTDQIFFIPDDCDEIFSPLFSLSSSISSFFSHNDIVKLIKEIKKYISEFLEKKSFEKVNYGIVDEYYFCGDLKEKYNIAIHTKMMKSLSKISAIPQTTPKDATEKIILCWLRYKCIPYSFAHMNVRKQYFDKLIETIPMTETLVSPFTSLNYEKKFHTLFEDTDSPFGGVSLSSNKKDGLFFIVPPINHIVDSVMEYINNSEYQFPFVLILLSPLQTMKQSILMKKIFSKRKNIQNVNNKFYNSQLEMIDNFSFFFPMKHRITEYTKIIIFCNDKKKTSSLFNATKLLNSKYFSRSSTSAEQKNETKSIVHKKKFFSSFDSNKNNVNDQNKKNLQATENFYEKLKKEYSRYIFVEELVSITNGYEWINILERFLISMANISSIEKNGDEIFSNIPLTHSIYLKLDSELEEKKIFFVGKISAKIKNKISVFLSSMSKTNKYKIHENFNYGNINNTFYCGNFRKSLDERRKIGLIKSCIEYFNVVEPKIHVTESMITELILSMLLRFECLLPRGQNWNLPHKWYYTIDKMLKINLEGFSNPLNSQMMIVKPFSSFGSLFNDTDKYFGSIGNIFSLDIEKFSLQQKTDVTTISLNPPYILSMMINTITLIDKWFKKIGKKKLRIIVGFPYWSDVKEIKSFEKYKYVKNYKILDIGEYYYENSLNENIPKIIHDKYEMFYLTNFSEDKDISTKIFDQMKPFF